ncbi:MAG TPA: protoporphyrinogen oxidase HemJ [Thiotrichaceae bacterium]|nr:protoporphyrinogen oxidase HemJ [Thiotrichaceae bacterium]
MDYHWIKAFHIIFMVTWFAGLFYLPRLYVYHAMDENKASFALFKVMERRLYIMMTLGAGLTLILGLILLYKHSFLLSLGWFQLKLAALLLLFIYHYACYRLMIQFRQDKNKHSHRWYRYFNEVPSLLLIAIVIFVVTKITL